MVEVYISHASDDLVLAQAIRDSLAGAGHSVFLDAHPQDGILVGSEWRTRLWDQLGRTDAVVCVVTGAFVASSWCTAEVAVADWTGLPVLPVLAEPGVRHDLLDHRQHVDLHRDRGYALSRLLEALRRLEPGDLVAPAAGRLPYPGLRAFDDNMARYFFGRSAEARRAAELLRSDVGDTRFVLVVGPSGCGKSSLVRAGVVPLLRAEPGWLVVRTVTPGLDPVRSLAAALVEAGRQAGLTWDVEDVGASLREPDGLRARIDQLSLSEAGSATAAGTDGAQPAVPGRRRRVLLVFDQLEELFTRAPAADQELFCRLLAAAFDAETRVVASLRSEFLDRLLTQPALLDVALRPFPLRPLSPALLSTVVTQPARLAGIHVDPELTARLVSDTGDGHALPLLAFVLRELAADAGRGGELSARRYDELGGVHGALRRQAGEALDKAAQTSGRTRDQVLAGLLRLVTMNDQGTFTARRVDQATLPPIVTTEYEQFIGRRLLTVESEPLAGPDGPAAKRGRRTVWIRVAHERLLTAWSPLTDALEQTRRTLAAARAVEDAAATWNIADRRDSYLWEADRLAATQVALGFGTQGTVRAEASVVELSPAGSDFLTAVAENVRRKRQGSRRRRATAFAVLSILLVLATVAASIAFVAQRAAHDAQRAALARSLVLRADTVRADDPEQALKLGMAGVQLSPGPATNTSLASTLASTRYAGILAEHSRGIASAAWSPDGRMLATAGGGGLVRLWDAHTPGEPRQIGESLPGYTDLVWKAAWTPDSHTLITVGIEGLVRFWDVSTAEEPREIGSVRAGPDSEVYAVSVSADGTALALRSDGGRVAVWDITDPQHPRPFGEPIGGGADVIYSVGLSNDGNLLATGDWDGGIRLWDLRAGGTPRQLSTEIKVEKNSEHVSSIAWSPDGRIISVGLLNNPPVVSGHAYLLDVSDPIKPSVIHRRFGAYIAPEPITAFAWSPDGLTLAGTTKEHTAILWDIRNPSEVQYIGAPLAAHTSNVSSATWSPDGATLATGAADGKVIRWDVEAPVLARRIAEVAMPEGVIGTYDMDLSPDGRTLAMAEGDSRTKIGLWDLSDRRMPRRSETTIIEESEVLGIAWSPVGRTLLVLRDHGVFHLWHVPEGAPAQSLGELSPFPGDEDFSAAWSPDGRSILINSDRTGFSIWDVSRPAQPRQVSRVDLADLADTVLDKLYGGIWSPNGRLLAVNNDRTVVLFDVTDQSHPVLIPGRLDHTEIIIGLAWSPDNRTLAASNRGKITFWDVSEPPRQRRISQIPDLTDTVTHHGESRRLTWSPDGHTLAGSGGDGPSLWDVTDPQNPHRLNQPRSGSYSDITWFPDGRAVLTATSSAQTPAVLWDVSTLIDQLNDPLSHACARLGRGLDQAEWEQLVPELDFENTCPGL